LEEKIKGEGIQREGGKMEREKEEKLPRVGVGGIVLFFFLLIYVVT